jgi:hypothetical protein
VPPRCIPPRWPLVVRVARGGTRRSNHAAPYASSMSLFGATVPAAWATPTLAVLALVTAVLVFMAWRKQSREVRDQGEMLRLQAEHLALDRKVNGEQIRVLGLQPMSSSTRAPTASARRKNGVELRPSSGTWGRHGRTRIRN